MIHSRRRVVIQFLLLLVFLVTGTRARADQNYSDQVFFENSLSQGNDFYSSGKVTPPSTL